MPSIAIVGKAFVRKEVSVVPCSKGLKVATTLGEENEAPPLADRTVTMASPSTPSLNCRQAIWTAPPSRPFRGSMAMVAPWDRRGCVGTG